jgi:hypothetical protein
MSVIGGQNTPTTNGLAYIIDFNNNYISGSSTVTPIFYLPTASQFTGSVPNLVNGQVQFTGSSVLRSFQTFPGFSAVQGNMTLMFSGESKNSNVLFTQDGTVAVVSTTSSIGYGVPAGNIGRNFPNTGLKHVTLRFNSSSVDCFVNGIPISASGMFPTVPSSSTFNDFKIGGNYLTSWTGSLSGSLGQLMVYNRVLTDDEIYSNYLIQARRYGLPEIPKPYTVDSSVYVYTQAAGITGSSTISALNTFVSGLKTAGLWDKMIAIYPFIGTNINASRLNLKDVSLNTTQVNYSGSWSTSLSGSYNNNTASYGILSNITPTYVHPLINSQSLHMSYLSYDTPTTGGFAMGATTGSIGTETGSAIFISPTEISSSANNVLTGSLTTGGPVGLITVSRTGSGNFKLWKNRVPTTITARASASLSNNIYLNSVNIGNTSVSSSQNTVAYTSVGAGLTDDEVYTYYELVNNFQKNIGRPDLDYMSILSYGATLGYTLPSTNQRVKQERLMSDLKQAGIWNKLDTFGVFATDGSSDFALIDWKRLTSYTAINTPLFTPNQGFTGNSSASSSILLNYQSVTNWVNASLNNASEFVWNFGQSGIVTGDSSISKYINIGTGSVNQRFHSNITLPFTFAANETVGLHSRVRNNSANYQLYYNQNLKGTTTTTSAMPTSDFFLFKVGVPGFFETWHNTSAKIYGYGAALTPTEISNLYTILNTYLNSLE